MIANCLAVGIGGFIGSVLRYLCGVAVPQGDFPFTTMAINVIGSFALAVLAGAVLSGAITDERLSLLLRVGLCGGFTTFSTFSLETMQLIQQSRAPEALAYALLTFGLCLCASFAGAALTTSGGAA